MEPIKVFNTVGPHRSECLDGKVPINTRGRVWNIVCKLDETKQRLLKQYQTKREIKTKELKRQKEDRKSID